MSLAHGPVMAFAEQQAPATQQMPVAGHASHHAAHSMQGMDHGAGHQMTPAVCFSSGCFVAVAPDWVATPMSNPLLLQRLSPGMPGTIVAAEPDLSDPPPRLQV